MAYLIYALDDDLKYELKNNPTFSLSFQGTDVLLFFQPACLPAYLIGAYISFRRPPLGDVGQLGSLDVVPFPSRVAVPPVPVVGLQLLVSSTVSDCS